MEPAPVRADRTCLILADRHQALLEGLQGLLRSRFDAVVTVSDEESLREAVRRMAPALVVLDLGLAADGLGALRRLRELRGDQRVVLLSLHDAAAAVEAAWRAGADGFVVKASIAEDLLPAADAVLGGRRFASAAAGGGR
ncbi:MAG TPA: response regulator [Thermoanaerobaculia bacterium]|nr:response regulator [Thermoanaerobaculia bacterium]